MANSSSDKQFGLFIFSISAQIKRFKQKIKVDLSAVGYYLFVVK